MPTQLDPTLTRRPGIPGFPVALADGQQWDLARPSRLLQPVFLSASDAGTGLEERVIVQVTSGFPGAILRQIREVQSACEARDTLRTREALVELGIQLLRRAHAVTREQAAELFRVETRCFTQLADTLLTVVTLEAIDES